MQIPAAKIYFPEESRKEILAKIDEVLSTGQLTLGKYGKQLEDEFSKMVDTKFAIAVSSGTSALEIILRCLDVEGKSVIVPTNTFFASPASVIHAGGRVIFADAKKNLCLDPADVERRIENDTVAVMFVHIGGLVPPEIETVREICHRHNLTLIEDAAHAHGSTLHGKFAGIFGKAAAFSFYPTKVMTSAEGGIIATDDEKIYQRALVFRDQGKASFFSNTHTELGYNWRLSEVHAVIGISQFHLLPQFIATRRKIAHIYDEGLKKIKGVSVLPVPSAAKSNYYKYVALLEKGIDRAAVKKKMKEDCGVSLSGEVYELPCHLQPFFKKLSGFHGGEYPVAEDLCSRHICLPISAVMTEEEAEYTLDSLKRSLK